MLSSVLWTLQIFDAICDFFLLTRAAGAAPHLCWEPLIYKSTCAQATKSLKNQQ